MIEAIKQLEDQKAKYEAEMQKKKEDMFTLKCQIKKIEKAISALNSDSK